MIVASIEAELIIALSPKTPIPNNYALPLKCLLYIHYLVHFKKDQIKSLALINAMILAYTKKLNL